MSRAMVRLTLIVAAALALTVVPAVIHGRYTNRWGPSADQVSAARQLERCPKIAGDWETRGKGVEFAPKVVRELQLSGYFGRTYVNRSDGETVSVVVMVGLPGALSRHPPEICYGARANQRIGEPVEVEISDGDQVQHRLRMLRFREPGPIGDEFTVCYGFTVDGRWDSPAYPRVRYGGKPLLYKMQVLFSGVGPDGSVPEPIEDFLTQFLPVVRDHVIRGSAPDGG